MLEFGFCGINYKQSDLDVRDKISFTESRKAELAGLLDKAGIHQCMVLSTCNRSEVFFFYQQGREEQVEEVRRIYQSMFPEIILGEKLISGTKTEALTYLFHVVCGMESLVPGEDQILGQVREAYEFSKAMGFCRKEMNRVVQDAISCAKKVKAEFKISEIPLSVSYVGIRELEKECGIKGKRVLIIGSGQTAALALKYVHDYGAGEITICNRTYAHARALKTQFSEITIGNYEDRYKIIEQCDIVISATSSPHLVIKEEKCPFKKLLFLDLAAPRDIDVLLGKRENCTLINLDMLNKVVQRNTKERELLIEKSRGVISQAVEETAMRLKSVKVEETIESLQDRCNDIVSDSLSYLNRKIDFSEREKKIVERTLRAGFHRLLREPIAELKRLESEEEQIKYQKALEKLFQI